MVSHPDTRMNALLLPVVLILSLKGGQMDPLSGGASIRALILRQMALCANGHRLYDIWCFFIAHSAHTVLEPYSPLKSYESKNKRPWIVRGARAGGGLRTKRAVNWEHTGTDLKAASVSVCCWGEEECATLSAVCLELRLCALLYNLTFADTSWLTYSPEQTRPNCSGPFGSLLVLSNGLGKYKFLVLAEKAALLRWPLLFTYIFTFFFITVPSAKVNAVTQIAAIPVLY